MSDADQPNVVQRMWSGWTRFWFTAADPTPLCFMRIVAGLLTLYVHVAYTFDLVAFFGPNGWYDHTEANRTRQRMPHVRGHANWERTEEFQMPQDERDRVILRDFVDRLIASPEPDHVLLFMHFISGAAGERNELLKYVERAGDINEFKAELQAFVDDKLTPEAQGLLPRFFERQVSPEARKSFTDSLSRFRALMPNDLDSRKRLLGLFSKTSEADWAAFQKLVIDLRAMEPERRIEYLDGFVEWGFPPKFVYARGMPTYSPWFHTKDLRFVWLIHGLHLLAIVAFTVGYNTRVFAVVTWLAGLAYIHRSQPYLFGQDTMMNLCLTYLMLSPCGAKWSVDRWLARKRAEATGTPLPPVVPSVSAGFVLRVFQIQYCLMYFSAGLAKLKGSSWWDGTAFFACMANPEFSPMHVDAYRAFIRWLCQHRALWEIVGVATSAFTLLTEIPFPYLVWTKMRPVVLAAALLMHTGIAILMGLSVFSLFMFALILCFFPADAINWMFGTEEDRA